MLRKRLQNIIDNDNSKAGRAFNSIIEFIIFFSILIYSLGTLPNNSPQIQNILSKLEALTMVIFGIEYILRIIAARKPLSYIFSFYGIIDLLAIIPYILGLTFDMRILKAFRIFRLFRALKLIRYNKAINRFYIAFHLIKEELMLFSMVTFIFLVIASEGIYFFEHDAQPKVFSSIFHSAWWAIITITTVGYGDVFPITIGGRIFTFIILFIGIAMISVPAGLLASSLTKAREIEEQKDIEEKSLED